MSQEMNRLPARHLANSPSLSRLSSFRGYLASAANAAQYSTSTPTNSRQLDERQGWRSWAGEKARKLGNYGLSAGWRATGADNDSADSTEVVTLFPGWAARRYRSARPGDEGSPRPFEVEAFTSGYAISYKNRDNMSRSQRAFIRVAKGFAALPKLAAQPSSSQTSLVSPEPAQLSKSTEDLLSQIHLPPRPDEIKDGYDTDALDREFQRARLESTDSTSDLVSALKNAEDRAPSMVQASGGLNPDEELVQRWHSNLETRLEPFWSSVVANRPVRLHLFVSPHQDPLSPPSDDQHKPLASIETMTASDGSFQAKFIVKWDELCHHPRALHIAFGEAVEEHTLVVVAELLKPQPVETSSYAQYQSSRGTQKQHSTTSISTTSQVPIPITHCPIRVISDIDDTVKDSGVLNGARVVFHNVFVKELKECVVPGMGEWYTSMWKRGIRFHYVSNGPFEYLSVLNDFFPLSQLPPGSIKLRSFAGRSLFNGFFSAPAARKRAGVEDILKAFPESRFFLIGDSGEQDLELYAELSSLYPNNVLGVFIRDVTTKEGVTDPLEDPTGWNALAIQQQSPNSLLLPLDTSSGVSSSGSERGSTAQISPVPYQPRSPSFRRSVSSTLMGAGRKASDSLWSHKNNAGQGTVNNDSEDTPRVESGPRFPSSNPPLTVTAEPESYNATPKISDASGDKPLNVNPPRGGVITEAPKPIMPPSLPPSNRHPSSNSAPSDPHSTKPTSRSQRTGTTSSASSQASIDERMPGPSSRQSTAASTLSLPTSGAGLSFDDRKRNELQMRVWRARTVMPGSVKLRVFRHPRDCVEEVDEILRREAE